MDQSQSPKWSLQIVGPGHRQRWPLAPGASLALGELTLEVQDDAAAQGAGQGSPRNTARLEALPSPASQSARDPKQVEFGALPIAWTRLRAGLMFHFGAADPAAAKRWQQAVLDKQFDADRCARELQGERVWNDHDPRVVEKSGTLLRDWLMAPYGRGLRRGVRRMKQAAAGGLAFVVVQFLVAGMFLLLLAMALVVGRLRFGFSADAWVDRILSQFGH